MKHHTAKLLTSALLALAFGTVTPTSSAADATHGNAHSSEERPFGKAGDAKKASRTIVIDMDDTMRFRPSRITVKQGETVQFVVKNSGKLLHEMVIGTMDSLRGIHKIIKAHSDMAHAEPMCRMCVRASRGRWSGNSPKQANSIMLA
jgi:uncharacterized cupredoxin-like copper-binding protein